jgi:hypothetical protein
MSFHDRIYPTVKQTRRLVRYWKPVFVRPSRGAMIFFYAGRTRTGGVAFYHHHHGDDLPHLHLSAAPTGTPHHAGQSPRQCDHALGHHPDHRRHEQNEPGHWHFAGAAATVPLLVVALCWISFLFSNESNRAHLLAAPQWARPPPALHP